MKILHKWDEMEWSIVSVKVPAFIIIGNKLN